MKGAHASARSSNMLSLGREIFKKVDMNRSSQADVVVSQDTGTGPPK